MNSCAFFNPIIMIERKNFKRPLHLVCAPSGDGRALDNVYFKKGYVIATNAEVLVKQSLALHGFTADEIKKMNNKHIHRDTFEVLCSFDKVEIDRGHLLATKGTTEAKFKLIKTEGPLIWEESFPDQVSAVSQISIDLNLIRVASDFTLQENKIVEVRFCAFNRPVSIKGLELGWDQEVILIAPYLSGGMIEKQADDALEEEIASLDGGTETPEEEEDFDDLL